MPDDLVVLAVVAKWALYLGVLGASGTVFCAALFGIARFHALAAVFAVVAMLAACVSFSLKGAALTGEAAGMLDTKMLSLLWQTNSGLMLKMQLCGLLLLLAGLAFGAVGLIVSVFGALISLLAFATIGHVTDNGNWLISAVLVVHLGAVAVWFGILVPLHRLAGNQGHLSEAAMVGMRFGRIAVLFVPLLLMAGGGLTYALVGSFVALTGTGYGRVLLAKTTVVSLLLGLGAVNKLRFVPALQRGEIASATRLRHSIAMEWVGFAVVLACTAVLTTSFSPPV